MSTSRKDYVVIEIEHNRDKSIKNFLWDKLLKRMLTKCHNTTSAEVVKIVDGDNGEVVELARNHIKQHGRLK